MTKHQPEHTPEPWHVDAGGLIDMQDQAALLTDEWCAIATGAETNDEEGVVALCHPDTARRIVAAVNALQGIPTEALENGAVAELIASVLSLPTDHDGLSYAVAIPNDTWRALERLLKTP
jgi:hypothetical protein